MNTKQTDNSYFNYARRKTVSVNVGGTPLGSDFPVRVQSMTNTSTDDVERSAEQCTRIAEAGAHYVRLTAQGVRQAESIGMIRNLLRKQGCNVPLVADIHFNPRAAFAAAALTDKVRINPGNFVDPARTFKLLEYTDEEYRAELQRVHDTLVPFIELCREHGTAVRLGVNHGSLSDRIMSRYGNTAAGMVESVMEFLRVFVEQNFMEVVISMKASNVVVMVEAVRRLVEAMDKEDMHFPLHLGVTEAGDGEDGRIKSAVGIGALLADGIGDTIRVSLSEDPEAEIPVARDLVNYINERVGHGIIEGPVVGPDMYNPIEPKRFSSTVVGKLGGGQPVCVCGGTQVGADVCIAGMLNYSYQELMYDDSIIEYLLNHPELPVIARCNNHNPVGSWRSFIFAIRSYGCTNPVIISRDYSFCESWEQVQLRAAADYGVMLIDQLVDGIMIHHDGFPIEKRVELAFSILQAARARFTKTEYIACPSCGRTLFDLKETLARIKAATADLKGLKIGVMGCIVNGPGEMADADYGYVGAGPGRVSLYKGKQCIEKNIPAEDAVDRLLAFIKEDCGK